MSAYNTFARFTVRSWLQTLSRCCMDASVLLLQARLAQCDAVITDMGPSAALRDLRQLGWEVKNGL